MTRPGRFGCGRWMVALLAVFVYQTCVYSQENDRSSSVKRKPSGAKSKSKANQAKSSGLDPRKPRSPRRINSRVYMGRPIADVMSFEGADWLVRAEREQEEKPETMLDSLKLHEGDVVADVGAGVGYLTLRVARRVGPKGRVFATDLQPEMLEALATNAKNFGITNIKPIRATPTDAKLPEGALDLILMTDVYHELSEPELTVSGLRKALKPGGRLVLVEFRGEDPEVPIKPEHKMTLKQVRAEIEPMGFIFSESIEVLPWQHIIIFEKPTPLPADQQKSGEQLKSEKPAAEKSRTEKKSEPE